MLFFLTSGDGDGGNESERGNAGGPEICPGCPLSAPQPRLSPPVPRSPSCSSVGVQEWSLQRRPGVCVRGRSQQLQPLQAREGLPRSNLAVRGGVRHVRRRRCCCHRVLVAGRLGKVASRGGDDEERVDGDTLTWNTRCMGLAGAPRESLVLPKLHLGLSIC